MNTHSNPELEKWQQQIESQIRDVKAQNRNLRWSQAILAWIVSGILAAGVMSLLSNY